MPHIIPPFTLSTDRGYKLLPVFDQYHAARGGRLVLWVEGGIAPYTWSVTGSDFVLDTASPSTTAVQYNFVTVNAAAVIDNRETVTITDANNVSVTIEVCTCNPTDCCDESDYAFTANVDIRANICPGEWGRITLVGGCPPFLWESNDSEYTFARKYTNNPSNSVLADKDAGCLGVNGPCAGETGTDPLFTITDECGSVVKADCLTSPALSFDDASTPDTIAPDGSITLYINGSCRTYGWSVTGTGFSLDCATTNGKTNVLNGTAGSCGVAVVTVTDSQGGSIEFTVRSTAGQWTILSNDCQLPGLPDSRDDNGSVHTFFKYSGKYRQKEIAHRNGTNNSPTRNCAAQTTGDYCCVLCDPIPNADCGVDLKCTQCIDYHADLEYPGYIVPCRQTGTGGSPDRIACAHIHTINYSEWECIP